MLQDLLQKYLQVIKASWIKIDISRLCIRYLIICFMYSYYSYYVLFEIWNSAISVTKITNSFYVYVYYVFIQLQLAVQVVSKQIIITVEYRW